jgi:cytochrome P450
VNVVTRESRSAIMRPGDTGRTWQVSSYAAARELLGDGGLSLEHADLSAEVLQARADLESALLAAWDADQPRIREILDTTADEMLAGLGASGATFNVKWDFALPMTNVVFAKVLGLPEEDTEQIREWFQNNLAGETYHSALGFKGIAAYLSEQIDARQGGDADDLLTRILAAVDMRSAPRAQVVANLAWLFIGLGSSVAHPAVTLGSLLLLTNPDQRALMDNDRALFPKAVDETFRLLDPSPTYKQTDTVFEAGEPFYAKRDIPIADVTVTKGDIVYINLAHANRDPSVFENPDQFVIGRSEERIAWEVPGEIFPSIVFVRPVAETCLRALFLGDRRLRLDDTDQIRLLDEPMRLRGGGLVVSFS